MNDYRDCTSVLQWPGLAHRADRVGERWDRPWYRARDQTFWILLPWKGLLLPQRRLGLDRADSAACKILGALQKQLINNIGSGDIQQQALVLGLALTYGVLAKNAALREAREATKQKRDQGRGKAA